MATVREDLIRVREIISQIKILQNRLQEYNKNLGSKYSDTIKLLQLKTKVKSYIKRIEDRFNHNHVLEVIYTTQNGGKYRKLFTGVTIQDIKAYFELYGVIHPEIKILEIREISLDSGSPL